MATEYEAVILDVDGTIVRGEETIEGAPEGLRTIEDANLSKLLFSNNPTRAPVHYSERLAAHDVAVDPDRVLTSASVTTDYLAANHAEDAIYLVGERRLRDLLEAAGLRVTDDAAAADVVLGSIDRRFDYDRLREAQRALDRDVPFYGTDPDVTIPAADGDVPGSGAVLAAMSAVAGRDPDAILGKPSPVAAAAALSRLDVDPERVLVVGDRLDTDVALGEQAGMTTALVRTGITSGAELDASSIEPDHVFDSLRDLGTVLDDS